MKKAPEKDRFAAVAVDVVVFGIHEGVLKTLLIDVDRPPYYVDIQGFPGGLIDPKETAEDAVVRHLKEKTGIARGFIEQLYTFSSVNRDKRNRVISIAYYSLVAPEVIEKHTHQHSLWVPVKTVGNLAYDHNEILKNAETRLSAKLSYTNCAQFLLPVHFTLTELQAVYEIVMGKVFDKRNFRKKVLALNILEETGRMQEGVQNRPAGLYRFVSKRLVELTLFT